MYSLLVTAKLNEVDPRAWLADVLARINDHPASRLHELLPWNWRKPPRTSPPQPEHVPRGLGRMVTPQRHALPFRSRMPAQSKDAAKKDWLMGS